MQLQCAVLLVVAFVLVNANDVLALVTSDQATATKTTASSFKVTAEDAVATRRLPRFNDAAGVEEDDSTERVNLPGISIVAELASKVNESAQKLARRMWLSSRETPDTVFVKLLGKTGINLDWDPKLVEWIRFTEAYNAKHGLGSFTEGKVYAMLSQRMSESGMEQLFRSLKKIPDLKKLGAKMENAHQVATRTPLNLFKTLGLEAAGAKLSSNDPNLLKWLHFTNKCIENGGAGQYSVEKINAMLSERMAKADLAGFYYSLKLEPDLKGLGKELQSLQFKQWFDGGVSVADVKGFLGTTQGSKEILRDYAVKYTSSQLFKSRVNEMKALYRGDNEGADVAATLAAYDKYYSNK